MGVGDRDRAEPVVGRRLIPRSLTASTRTLTTVTTPPRHPSERQFRAFTGPGAGQFDPLEISTRPAAEVMAGPESLDDYQRAGFTWPTDPQGRHIGGGGQKLTARDMARFGQLWLQNGRWGERQLVPAGWIQAARTDQVPVSFDPAEAYGYQVWLGTADGHEALFAFRFAGQVIEIVPDLGLVVAVLSRHNPDPRIPEEPGTADTEHTELVPLIAHTIQ